MDWLNYHHLLYFWTVAREGTMTKACERLSLAQPTISGQIRSLEQSLGEKLFARVGRKLVLTEKGQTVFRYADQIFSLGRELTNILKGRLAERPTRLVVGVTEVLPKLVAYRLLEPALLLVGPVRIICREGKLERLMGELEAHEIDVILADAPASPSSTIPAYTHMLGESGISFFAARSLAKEHRRKFPHSLDGAPFLLPTDDTSLRRSLEHWFNKEEIRPMVIGEFEDSALLKAFGQGGRGIFAMPSVIETEVSLQYDVQVVGRTEAITERFYAISLEQKRQHPAVAAIAEKKAP